MRSIGLWAADRVRAGRWRAGTLVAACVAALLAVHLSVVALSQQGGAPSGTAEPGNSVLQNHPPCGSETTGVPIDKEWDCDGKLPPPPPKEPYPWDPSRRGDGGPGTPGGDTGGGPTTGGGNGGPTTGGGQGGPSTGSGPFAGGGAPGGPVTGGVADPIAEDPDVPTGSGGGSLFGPGGWFWTRDRSVHVEDGSVAYWLDQGYYPGVPSDFGVRIGAYYESNVDFNGFGSVGSNWYHTFYKRAFPQGNGDVKIIDHDRGSNRLATIYTFDPVSGGFLSPPAKSDTLTTLPGGGWRVTALDNHRTDFDAQGRVVAQFDPNGNIIDYVYDTNGDLALVVDSIGRPFTVTTVDGYIVRVTDFEGNEYDYAQDEYKDLVEAGAPASDFLQTGGGAMAMSASTTTSTTTVTGGAATVGGAGRTAGIRAWGTARRWSLAISKTTQQRLKQYLQGRIANATLLTVDTAARTKAYTGATQPTTTGGGGGGTAQTLGGGGGLSYLPAHHVPKSQGTAQNGTKTITSFTYTTGNVQGSGAGNVSLHHNLVSVTEPNGSVTMYNTYDANDRMVTQTNGKGGVWTISYPSPNQRTAIDPLGNRTDYTLANGSVINIYRYTRTGQGQTALRPGEPNWYHTQYQRNHPSGSGLITATVHPSGMREEFYYDPQLQLIELRQYDQALSAYLKQTWVWNGSGRMTQFIPASGWQTGTPANYAYANTFDAAGNLLTTTHPTVTVNGQPQTTTYTFTYTAKGQVASLTFPDGTVRQFGYSPTGTDKDLLVSVTNDFGGPEQTTHTITYDALGNPISYTKAGQRFVEFRYDALRRRIGVLEAGIWKESYIYDENGRQIETIMDNELAGGSLDPAMPTIHRLWTYDADDDVVTEAQDVNLTANDQITLGRDLKGSVISFTDALGDTDTRELDERDLVFREHRAWGTADVGTWTYDYDLDGRLVQVTDPRSRVTSLAVDSFFRPFRTTFPDLTVRELLWTANLLPVQDSMLDSGGGLVWRRRMEYDVKDRLVMVHEDRVVVGSVVGTLSGTLEYDARDRLVAIADPDGASRTYEFDRIGRQRASVDSAGNRVEYTYTPQGNLALAVHRQQLAGGATNDVTREWVRDATDKLTAYEIRGTQTTRRWEYETNNRGLILKIVDPLGNVGHFAHDGVGRVLSETAEIRAGGTGAGALVGTSTVAYSYDLVGRTTSVTDPAGNTRTFGYDHRGRLTSVTEADTVARQYTYNAVSEVTGWTDQAGNVFTVTYDAASRPVSRTVALASGFAGPTTETFTYDALGYLTSATRGGSTVTTARDSQGLLLSETQSGYTHSATYDARGRRQSHQRFDGTQAAYTWDTNWRLSSVAWGGITRATYTLHGTGLVASRANANGTVTNIGYTDLNQINRVTNVGPGGLTWDTTYGYDGIGNLHTETWLHRGGAGNIWAYDSQYQITQGKESVANVAAELAGPGTQAMAQLVNVAYDVARNRTSRTVTTAGGTTNTAYGVDTRNFYNIVGGVARTRDANGNLRNDGTNAYTWDALDQLVGVSGPGGLSVTFAYDAGKRRYQKVTPTGTVTYLYDELHCIEERSGSGLLLASYLYGERLDEVLQSTRLDLLDQNGNNVTNEYLTYTYHQDRLGNVVEITDAAGAVVETYEYDSYGTPTIRNAVGTVISASLIGNEIMFHGARRDPETGLYHMRNRYYDPGTGRFLSTDALGQVDDANMYQFVHNSPNVAKDPYGLSEFNFDIIATLKNFTKDQFVQLVHELKDVLRELLDLIPGLGEILNVVAYITGKDPVTGEEKTFGFWDKVELAADVISLVFIGGKIVMKALQVLEKLSTMKKLVEKVQAAIAKVAGIARGAACKVGITDGCFTPTTLVHTANGLLAIDTLAPGAGQSGWARGSADRPDVSAQDDPEPVGSSINIWTDDREAEPARWVGGRWLWVHARGWTRVRDLVPGDEIVGADGSRVRVLHVASAEAPKVPSIAPIPALAGEGR